MTNKIMMSAVLAAALTTAAAVPAAHAAFPILGAGKAAEGVVTAFDLPRATITIGTDTYYMQGPSDMDFVQTGERVRIDYVLNNDKRMAVGIKLLDVPNEKQAAKTTGEIERNDLTFTQEADQKLAD